jgi:uncharacterized protein (TIGR02118 family)
VAAHLLVLYNKPADPAAFDAYYTSKHVPIAKKIPGLRQYGISRGTVSAPGGGDAPYYLIADLEFDTLDAIQDALGSPEGAAAAGDVPNFATGGVTMLTYEATDV